MTDVGFYHLTATTLEAALPRLLEKVLAAGQRAVVLAGSPERVEALNGQLWTYNPGSFLPHGSKADGSAADQPIWLTDQDENPNGAGVLVLTEGVRSERVGEFARCLDLFDGADAQAVADARVRWTDYKAKGFGVTYWQQTSSGGWEKKA
ncbi:MAG TPA: DNA polymerase III subunit chi [Alphaproteobacteria bacterium]|jgi:DNA polymerase-3 subunit chi|nr:DNA polymerase III subunit chi [Alphaproteobacteria bacterium]